MNKASKVLTVILGFILAAPIAAAEDPTGEDPISDVDSHDVPVHNALETKFWISAVDLFATRGFRVTGRCPDGVVECIESEMPDWFAVGTQFHPESDSASALDMRIFEEFIDGVKAAQEMAARGPEFQLVGTAA